MRKPRRHFTGAEKVSILKRHLIDKVTISALADEFELLPTQIYNWLKEFFENGHVAFHNARASKAADNAKDQTIGRLEAKIQRKDSVLAELMEEHVALKKSLGES